MKFDTWLDTFLNEKNIDLEHDFEVQGESGLNIIPAGVVVEHIKIASAGEQEQIKNTLVMIDFKNGDVYHFLNHLAGAIAR